MIPFIIVPLFLTAVTWFFYCKFLEKYEKIMELNKLVEYIWISRDLERLQVIIEILSKESNLIMNYKFDIDLKERFFNDEEARKEKMMLRKSKEKMRSMNISKSNFKIPKL